MKIKIAVHVDAQFVLGQIDDMTTTGYDVVLPPQEGPDGLRFGTGFHDDDSIHNDKNLGSKGDRPARPPPRIRINQFPSILLVLILP